MSDIERRIERVAMLAANADATGEEFVRLAREKVPGVSREEIDRGIIRGDNRRENRLRAKFGKPPVAGIPEGPFDHDGDDDA